MTDHSAPQPSGCLPAIFRIFGSGGGGGAPSSTAKSGGPLPYKRKDWLFSKAERSFFGVLQPAVAALTPALSQGEREKAGYLIFAKTRIGDLLWLPKGTEGRQSHWNKIQSKHVDFVICSSDEVRPLLAIELDDSSHGAEKRQTRDAFVEEAFKAAGLPLLRVPCKAGYNVTELAAQIRSALQASASAK